jgi:hypothetical protein
MFFTWEDLGIDAQQPRKCEAKNGAYDKAGEWRTGTIKDIVKNKFKKYVYACVFDTPGRYTGLFSGAEIKEARTNFLKIQAIHADELNSSDDGLSSCDGADDRNAAQAKTLSDKSKIKETSPAKVKVTDEAADVAAALLSPLKTGPDDELQSTRKDHDAAIPLPTDDTVPANMALTSPAKGEDADVAADVAAALQSESKTGPDAELPSTRKDHDAAIPLQTDDTTPANLALTSPAKGKDTDVAAEDAATLHSESKTAPEAELPSTRKDHDAPNPLQTDDTIPANLSVTPPSKEGGKVADAGADEVETTDTRAAQATPIPTDTAEKTDDKKRSDEREHDAGSKERVGLAKRLSTLMEEDKPLGLDNTAVSTTTKYNSRRAKQDLRLLKNKIAAAVAQNKPEVAQQLRLAAAKLLLTVRKREKLQNVGGKKLTGTKPDTNLHASTKHGPPTLLKLQKRGYEVGNGTINYSVKRAKSATIKKTNTAAAAYTWEEPYGSVPGDHETQNEDYDDTDMATDEGVDLNKDDWYWDEKFQTWVFTGSKRPRKRDLTNKVERNWVLGMRRNWDTAKQAKLLEKITITREHLSTVRTPFFNDAPVVPFVLT